MAIGVIGGLASGVFGAISGGAARRRARRRQKALMKQIEKLEGERQDIINPFEGVKNILTNPFANLTVADQAAQMQAQQTDLSLASTLDTLNLQQQLANAEVRGQQFVFGATERREMQQLNRLSSLAGAASQQAAAAETQMLGGIGSALGAVGTGFGNLASGLSFTGAK